MFQKGLPFIKLGGHEITSPVRYKAEFPLLKANYVLQHLQKNMVS